MWFRFNHESKYPNGNNKHLKKKRVTLYIDIEQFKQNLHHCYCSNCKNSIYVYFCRMIGHIAIWRFVWVFFDMLLIQSMKSL